MTSNKCWVCGSDKILLVKPRNIKGDITSISFCITDNNYGETDNIYQCSECGFMQCSGFEDVLPFYQDLIDEEYDVGRNQRLLQFKQIMKVINKYAAGKKLLDIGAGSGMLVEQALKMGFDAIGIEPSEWLQAKAAEYNLPVYLGTFPHGQCTGPYNIVTLIDVVEHIPEPLQLLSSIHEVLTKDGIFVVVTPDAGSIAARILGWKWWHFRVAHVGYFNQKTLDKIMFNAGFEPIGICRPKWYFGMDYLFDRVMRYLPDFLRIAAPGFLKNITIPLNLGDSIMRIYKARKSSNGY